MAKGFYETYMNNFNLTDWKMTTDDKKDGLQIWQRQAPNGLKAMKAQAYINRCPEDIFEVI